MEIKELVIQKAKLAKGAARYMGTMSTDSKNKGLIYMAEILEKNIPFIISQNNIDMVNGRDKGLSNSLLDRLLLTEDRVRDMANALREVAKLEDPIGEGIKTFKRPNGLKISSVKVPLGVIGIIYEARPNVTVDAAALCIKSGNTVILKGGSEALYSNKAIADILYSAGINSGFPEGFLQFIDITDREAVSVMVKLNEYIDVIIPRGGYGLINAVIKSSTVPVIETGVGNCHIFVDKTADFNKAVDIIINSKTQRPAVCNAMETLLIHEDVANEFLPLISKVLKEKNVEIRGCIKSKSILDDINIASEEDYRKEFLDLILAVKIVKDIDEAIEHIFLYGTKHSEAILTNDYNSAEKFQAQVDAAVVYVNASTRFTDGSEFGFGAEIGISTQKLHARGPMGIKELTTTKYLVNGDGQIRN